jgi:L-arabinose isomerase
LYDLKPKVGLATIMSPYEVGGSASEAQHAKAAKLLSDTGLTVTSAQTIVDSNDDGVEVGRQFRNQDLDVVCLLYGTYADDTFATSVIEESNLPPIIWGTNQFDTGSIAGAQQVSAVLSEVGRYYRLVFGDVDDSRAIRQVSATAKVAAARRRLRECRVGVIGYQRIAGQTQAAFDEVELHERIGGRVVCVGSHRFVSLMQTLKDSEVQTVWRKVSEGVGRVSVNDQQIAEGVKAYLALKKIVEDNKLNAVAFEDWNDFIGIPNLGFALLNEEGVPAGCEADVHSTLMLYLLALLTGKPAFHGELLGILEKEDALLVAHYGAGAPSLAASRNQISLEPDRASHNGVSVVYQIRPGPVTIASLTGRRGTYRMFIASGQTIPAREVFHGGVVANVKFNAGNKQVLQKARGMSHHWMVGIGDVSDDISEFCEMVGIRSVVV